MPVLRVLLGAVGGLLVIVLLVLGVVLSPVLLLLAPIPLLGYLVWKLLKVRRSAGRALQRPGKEAHKAKKKVEKKVKKAL